MILRVVQALKAHHVNQLHEEMLAAGVRLRRPPESLPDGSESTFEVEDADQALAQGVVTAHVPAPRTPPDLRAMWTAYRTNLQAATTLAQLKAVLTNDLNPILRLLLRGHRENVNGP